MNYSPAYLGIDPITATMLTVKGVTTAERLLRERRDRAENRLHEAQTAAERERLRKELARIDKEITDIRQERQSIESGRKNILIITGIAAGGALLLGIIAARKRR